MMGKRRSIVAALLLAAAASALGGCATRQAQEPNPDPLEPVNRAVYRFNDVADRYVGRPVARTYRKVLPETVRNHTSSFFDNLLYPITVVNQLLQGKFRQGGADIARFTVNSTVGLLGFFDPATGMGLEAHDEDFGQTLTVWGVPQGPYLVVPVFGPRTLTHAIGNLADTQVSILNQYNDSSVRSKVGLWYIVHRRYELLDLDEEIDKAFDRYLFVRDAYLQNRNFQIHDGEVPEEEWYPEDEELDEEIDEEPSA